jgi:hypothetical protein
MRVRSRIVQGCDGKSRAKRGFFGLAVGASDYFTLVALPSMILAQAPPSVELSNVKV